MYETTCLIRKRLEPLFFEIQNAPKQEILFESNKSIFNKLLQQQNEKFSDTIFLTKREIFDIVIPNGFKIESLACIMKVYTNKQYRQLRNLLNFQNVSISDSGKLKITNDYITDKEFININLIEGITIKPDKIRALYKTSSGEFYKKEIKSSNDDLFDLVSRLHIFNNNTVTKYKDILVFFQSYYTIQSSDDFENIPLNFKELESLENYLGNDFFSINYHKQSISFDINKVEDLEIGLNKLKSLPFVETDFRRNNHRYKVKLDNTVDSFSQLKKHIKDKFQWVEFRDRLGGEQTIVSIEYSLDEKGENRLRNFIDFAHEQAQAYDARIEIFDDTKFVFQIKYNKEAARIAENQKLSLLKGAVITWQKKILGNVFKINNQRLIVRLDENLTKEFKDALASKIHQIQSIKPELQGEVDKLYRLQEVVQTIDDKKKTIVNPKLRDFFFDSSKATPTNERFFEPTNEKWLEIIENVQSKTLSTSQKRAVASALYAEDIALIQGPPGTGKSTVIAEIIWQHLFRNPKQKILLTSETHMAVDNAIERVVKNYNIVKPIRFGDDAKLENEGARFSLNRLKKWVKPNNTEFDEDLDITDEKDNENIDDNILRIWFDNICKRSQIQSVTDENSSSLRWWHEYLQSYPNTLKELFLNKYIANANLLGATSSSIGWKNGEDKWTKFFKQWLELYPNDAKSKSSPLKFDVTIIDEASKATPPELALPLLFSKKGIIVGDHRQLPPMLDDDEFETTLELNGEKELLREFKKFDTSKSHFEKLFLNPELSPTLKTTFDTQFRMHPAIGSVIQQFYKEDLGEGGLKCGLDSLKVDGAFEEPQSRYHGLNLLGFIKPNQHCIWVNVETPEIKEGTSRVNYGEVEAVKWVLNSIKGSDGFDNYMNYFGNPQKKVEDSEIGIISFYGKQLQALQLNIQDHNNLRISTVDRFQGMERNIVIVSLVRSDKIANTKLQEPNFESFDKGYQNQPDLGFAKSPNRLNVALSRAKRLLIIVGNATHFSQKEMYANVIKQIKNSDEGSFINFPL